MDSLPYLIVANYPGSHLEIEQSLWGAWKSSSLNFSTGRGGRAEAREAGLEIMGSFVKINGQDDGQQTGNLCLRGDYWR